MNRREVLAGLAALSAASPAAALPVREMARRGLLGRRDPYRGHPLFGTPDLVLDWAGVETGGAPIYKRNGLVLPTEAAGVTRTRSGADLIYPDRDGVYRAYPADVGAIIPGVGTPIWEARTNYSPNYGLAGAVVGELGAGGALPDGWTWDGPTGVTVEVAEIGEEYGLPYIDLRAHGTASGVTSLRYRLGTGAIPSASGQTWALSMGSRLVAGAYVSGLISERLVLSGVNSGGGVLSGATSSTVMTSTESFARLSHVGTPADDTMTGIVVYKYWTWANGVTADFTIRLYPLQAEKGSFVGPLIRTENTSATRGAESAYVPWTPGPTGYAYARWRIPQGMSGVGVARRVLGTDGDLQAAIIGMRGGGGGIQAWDGSNAITSAAVTTLGEWVSGVTTWEPGKRTILMTGGTAASDANGLGTGITRLYFGSDDVTTAAYYLDEAMARVVVGSQALTASQMQAMVAQ